MTVNDYMTLADLSEGLLVQDGRSVLKISNVYENYCTAQLMLTAKGVPPTRTAVRYYEEKDVVARLKGCSDHMFEKYEEAYK